MPEEQHAQRQQAARAVEAARVGRSSAGMAGGGVVGGPEQPQEPARVAAPSAPCHSLSVARQVCGDDEFDDSGFETVRVKPCAKPKPPDDVRARRGDGLLVFTERARERLEACVGAWYRPALPFGDG